MEKGLNTNEVTGALALKFCAPEFAFFTQVFRSTGYAGRIADAVAINLWPSRGLEVHGFEVKISRSDWLRELKHPEKAEPIARYCDRWWIAVGDKSIVQEGELPPTWGLLIPRGKSLIRKVAAPKIDSKELDRGFVTSIIRRFSEGMIPRASIKAEIDDAYDRGVEAEKGSAKYDRELLADLRKTVAMFEEKSGVKIRSWNVGPIGNAVRFVEQHGPDGIRRQMKSMKHDLERLLGEVNECLREKTEPILRRVRK